MSETNIQPIYPYEDWRITETEWNPENNLRNETIFSTGNGYIGMRGNFEEGYGGPEGTSVNGTYLNGFYDSEPIIYGEEAYGYAKKSQTMLNVTDAKIIRLRVDGEPFTLFEGAVRDYRRTLDMREGILTREVTWETSSGKRVRVRIRRLVSLSRKHLAIIRFEVTPLNFDGSIQLESCLNGAVRNQVSTGDPRAGSSFSGQVLMTEELQAEATLGAIRQRTRQTRFSLVCAMENLLECQSPTEPETETGDQTVSVRWNLEAKREVPVTLTKTIAYFTSRDYPEDELLPRALREVTEGKNLGFSKLAEEQKQFLNGFWYRSDVEIQGDPALQQGIRYNAFQLLQSAGRDGKTNIGAKGLTGEGYEGHYFWDTETYILPFFLYTHPSIAKSLLQYRFHILDKARERARELSHKGALYAWRTIGGEETSPYYPAGTAQVHINADILYALKKYMNATEDKAFFLEAGAEMLFETARFWVDLGEWIPDKGFCINGVTGPDEYTAIVNNNAYTNLMVQDHLEYAAESARRMEREHPEQYRALAERIGLAEEERQSWKKAAEGMYIPRDRGRGIIPQDDSFLEKAPWDFENTPKDRYPLLLHYHPLNIYRHQVLKQADLVLALFLQSSRFTLAEKKRNYDFYEPLTTHDSSLSPCIHSILAAELGYGEKAYRYFMQTARMDLDDYNKNVKDGIHTASMAGTWLSIVHGFGGFRENGGELFFSPTIPSRWKEYRFRLQYRNRLIEVQVRPREAVYTLLEGEPLTLHHRGRPLRLTGSQPVSAGITRELEAVVFDLDGVLTDTAEYHYQAWKQLADELGIPFDRDFNEELKGLGRMDSLDRILEKGGKSFSEEEKRRLADRKNGHYRKRIQRISPEDLLPGMGRLLRELKENGIRIALASASKNARTVIRQLKIESFFDTIVDAAHVSKGKPDPEIFLTAAEQLGVPRTNCAAVEDAEAGIRAIREADMFAVGVGTETAMKGADWIVSDTSKLTLQELKRRFR
ncbi:alpha,alpha-trehalose phosphorylase [Melghirimyces profundicolus]|uniref:Beta-phosphoglucomutase n=1 Tax=Melghirimyces profundicolus TaxID=1242148 RepID=A0A2T6C935_9BACL|nr:beta-phosphoglucomutase [Melghirimyces profundicolus]PTX64825.1 alpha,alpha-trehalose phosphorylase [Melghirimyces profundicolus]